MTRNHCITNLVNWIRAGISNGTLDTSSREQIEKRIAEYNREHDCKLSVNAFYCAIDIIESQEGG